VDNHQFSHRLKTCKDGVTSGLRSSGRRCLFLAGFGSWREDELPLLSDISPDRVARPLHGVIPVAAVPPGGTDSAEAPRLESDSLEVARASWPNNLAPAENFGRGQPRNFCWQHPVDLDLDVGSNHFLRPE